MEQRDATIVSVLYYAGLRPGEMLALNWADVEQGHLSVTKALSLGQVKSTKTGKGRRVPMIPALRSDLLQWRFACGGGPATGPCSRIRGRALERARLEDVGREEAQARPEGGRATGRAEGLRPASRARLAADRLRAQRDRGRQEARTLADDVHGRLCARFRGVGGEAHRNRGPGQDREGRAGTTLLDLMLRR